MYGNGIPKQFQNQFLTDPRLALAAELQRSGSSTAPVQSPLEGLARALTGVVGGYQQGLIQDEYKNRGKEFASALSEVSSDPRVNTGIPSIQDAPGPNMDGSAGWSRPGAAPGYDTMVRLLQGDKYSENPDLQEYANQLQGKSLESQMAMQNDLTLERAKYTDPAILGGKIAIAQAGATGIQKPPSGYRYNMQGSLEPIMGGPEDPNKKKFTPEQAGKVSMVKNAVEAMKEVKTALFDENGKVKSMVDLTNAYIGTPGTEGARIRNLLSNAVEAQLRSETGAAATKDEIDRMLKRFLPAPFDNADTKRQKVEQLTNLLGGTLEAEGVPVPTQPSAPVNLSKTVNGKTYFQQDGQWFEQ